MNSHDENVPAPEEEVPQITTGEEKAPAQPAESPEESYDNSNVCGYMEAVFGGGLERFQPNPSGPGGTTDPTTIGGGKVYPIPHHKDPLQSQVRFLCNTFKATIYQLGGRLYVLNKILQDEHGRPAQTPDGQFQRVHQGLMLYFSPERLPDMTVREFTHKDVIAARDLILQMDAGPDGETWLEGRIDSLKNIYESGCRSALWVTKHADPYRNREGNWAYGNPLDKMDLALIMNIPSGAADVVLPDGVDESQRAYWTNVSPAELRAMRNASRFGAGRPSYGRARGVTPTSQQPTPDVGGGSYEGVAPF